MAKKKRVEQEEGVDLSTDAELWTEEEIRQMIREEYLKLLFERQGQTTIQPNIQPYINPYSSYPTPHPGWQQTTGGNINHLNDGHYTVNCSVDNVHAAVSC